MTGNGTPDRHSDEESAVPGADDQYAPLPPVPHWLQAPFVADDPAEPADTGDDAFSGPAFLPPPPPVPGWVPVPASEEPEASGPSLPETGAPSLPDAGAPSLPEAGEPSLPDPGAVAPAPPVNPAAPAPIPPSFSRPEARTPLDPSPADVQEAGEAQPASGERASEAPPPFEPTPWGGPELPAWGEPPQAAAWPTTATPGQAPAPAPIPWHGAPQAPPPGEPAQPPPPFAPGGASFTPGGPSPFTGQPGPTALPAPGGPPSPTGSSPTAPTAPPGPNASASQQAAAPASPAVPYEPWRRQGPARPRVPTRTILIAVAGVAAVGLVATGVVVMLSGSDSGKDGSAVDVRKAGLAFGTDPAAKTDGRDQELNAVAASGDTVVTAGGDADHTGYQARFMVSADGGRTFRTAPVRTSDGEEPVLGEAPRQMAVSPKGWLAIGDRPGGNVVWTSKDGREWIRRPDMASATFGTRDRISRLIGTQQGFLAVGATSASGDFKDAAPALWISGDGQSWQRLTGDRLSLVSGRGTLWLTNAAATGGTMLIQGVYTPKSSGKSPRNLLWRSADGGRTWKEVTVPSPRGTGGLNIGPMPNGFIAVREINPKSNAHGAVFTSPDGTQWTRTGSITAPGYERVWRLSASSQGVTAAVQATGKVVLDSSQDAATWRLSGEVAAPGSRTLLDTTTVANGNVLVGRDQSQDVNAVLTVRDAQGQDVQAALPAAQPDDMVQAVAASGGRAVAVGSANGHAAVWNSPDGGTHWNRSDVGTLVRSGRQRLLDVTSGSAGWLAVGVDTAAPWRSIVAASADGTTWQPADRVSAFKPESGTTLVTYGAASGPGGYVIVGEEGLAPATWFSSDLKSWTRGTGETRDDLSGRQGANRWMRGVVSGSFGYVAVGGQLDPSIQNAPAVRPAVWTSADGRTWADHQLPVPSGALQGSFVSVAVKGGVLVAAGGADTQTGLAPFAFVSTDGGRSWQEAKVPVTGGQPVPTTVSKVVATPKGFAMAGVAGHPANGDVVLWTSKDGRTWTPAENLPSGLGGRGNQELAGLATVGGELLAVGSTRDSQGSQPLLWKTPAP